MTDLAGIIHEQGGIELKRKSIWPDWDTAIQILLAIAAINTGITVVFLGWILDALRAMG